jgi:hypothetical protein
MAAASAGSAGRILTAAVVRILGPILLHANCVAELTPTLLGLNTIAVSTKGADEQS